MSVAVEAPTTSELLGSKRTQNLIDYTQVEDEESKRAKVGTTTTVATTDGIRACPMSAMQSRMRNPSRNFVMCKMFEAEGTCRFGDKCSFAHSEAEITAWQTQRDTSLATTGIPTQTETSVRQCPPRAMQSRVENPARNFVMCKMFNQGGTCKFGDECSFAHSEAELTQWTRQRDQQVSGGQMGMGMGMGMMPQGMPMMPQGMPYAQPQQSMQYAQFAQPTGMGGMPAMAPLPMANGLSQMPGAPLAMGQPLGASMWHNDTLPTAQPIIPAGMQQQGYPTAPPGGQQVPYAMPFSQGLDLDLGLGAGQQQQGMMQQQQGMMQQQQQSLYQSQDMYGGANPGYGVNPSNPSYGVNQSLFSQEAQDVGEGGMRPCPQQALEAVQQGRSRGFGLCRNFSTGTCQFGNKCSFAHGEQERDAWKAQAGLS